MTQLKMFYIENKKPLIRIFLATIVFVVFLSVVSFFPTV